MRKIKSQTEWVEGDDAAANFRGARDMGLAPGKGGYGLDAVLSGKASPEVIVVADADFAAIADDAAKVAALRKARFLAVAARTANALTRAADVVLPGRVARREGRHVHERPGTRPEVRARLPPEAARPGALGAPPAARRRARLRRPQLDARGPARARSRSEVPAYAGDRREGPRGRQAPQEGRLRLGGNAVTGRRLGDRRPAGRAAGADLPGPRHPARPGSSGAGAAFIQDRLGPNRVGPFGLLQAVADIVKLFMKEDVIAGRARTGSSSCSPRRSRSSPRSRRSRSFPTARPSRSAAAEIPLIGADVSIGILYVFAITSLSRLRHRPRGLVVEQQVLADGRHPLERADHLLRARDDDGGRGRDPRRRAPSA